MNTTQENQTNNQRIEESFGVRDSKGREVGASAHSYEIDFVVTEEKWGVYTDVEPGHYFCFYARATRDGQGFGASHGTQRFTTAAARDAAIAKYIAGARKRASKAAANT